MRAVATENEAKRRIAEHTAPARKFTAEHRARTRPAFALSDARNSATYLVAVKAVPREAMVESVKSVLMTIANSPNTSRPRSFATAMFTRRVLPLLKTAATRLNVNPAPKRARKLARLTASMGSSPRVRQGRPCDSCYRTSPQASRQRRWIPADPSRSRGRSSSEGGSGRREAGVRGVNTSGYSILDRFATRLPRQPFFMFVHHFDPYRPHMLHRGGRAIRGIRLGEPADGGLRFGIGS